MSATVTTLDKPRPAERSQLKETWRNLRRSPSGVIGLTIACLASPPEAVERVLIPAVWLWPILIWAEMGSRKSRHNTEQMVFVSPHLAKRQLPAMWLAGVLVAAIATSGAALPYVTTGKPELLLAWIVGCCFVPALAMALGVWSKVGRLFEITYAMWWYFGLLSRVAIFDFAGIGGMGIFPVVYLAITAGLLLLAIARRQRQIA